MDEAALLGCIAWVAHGFEIVHSMFAGWRFAAADTVAAFALHGAYRLGPRRPIAERRPKDGFRCCRGSRSASIATTNSSIAARRPTCWMVRSRRCATLTICWPPTATTRRWPPARSSRPAPSPAPSRCARRNLAHGAAWARPFAHGHPVHMTAGFRSRRPFQSGLHSGASSHDCLLAALAVALLSVAALSAQAATPDGVTVSARRRLRPCQAADHGCLSAGREAEGGAGHPDGAWRRLALRRQAASAGGGEQGRALGAEGLHLRLGQLPDGAGERSGRAGRRHRAGAGRGASGGARAGAAIPRASS